MNIDMGNTKDYVETQINSVCYDRPYYIVPMTAYRL